MGNEGSKKVTKGSLDNHLQTASKTGALNLSNRKLENVPQKLTSLCTNLRMLDLSSNHISDISAIGSLQNLQKLNISHNKIQNISYVLALTKLKSLDASHNLIEIIPSIGTNVRQLNLANNKIFQIHSQFIKNLDSLDLQSNVLSQIPEDFQSDTLVEVNFNNNKLNKLNAYVFIRCGRLKVLRVKNNCLEVTEFSSVFLKESKISTIEFEGNRFHEKAFKELDGFDEFDKRRTQMMMKKD